MNLRTIQDVEFGANLASFIPDTSLPNVGDFADAVGWHANRFKDHALARKEGLPGALVPGIMGMGFLTTMIHQWAANASIESIDTVFRAPMLADEPLDISAIVTDIDEETGQVELDLTTKNAAGETRLFGTARVCLPLN